MGPLLDALDEATLARMPLSTVEAVRQEHRMPFARSLKHALRIFCQTHNTLQVVSAGDPHNKALVTKLERDTKLLHITPNLLQPSDGRSSRQRREGANGVGGGIGAGGGNGDGNEVEVGNGDGDGAGAGKGTEWR